MIIQWSENSFGSPEAYTYYGRKTLWHSWRITKNRKTYNLLLNGATIKTGSSVSGLMDLAERLVKLLGHRGLI
jgi:hypothetical protein